MARPQKTFHFTLRDFVLHLEEMLARVFAAGASTGVALAEPGPEVWVGVERGRGANAYTLLKVRSGSAGDGEQWKIAGIADTQFPPPPPPARDTRRRRFW